MNQSPRRLLNYSLGREIGRGGMASVWYAENSVGRKFAVKLLKPELVAEESSVAERFRNEAQIMVRLEHPAILRVEDFYEEGTTLAIIMEYLVGHDLNQHSRLQGPLPEAQVVEWFTRVLDAFAYVHQKGYFHRDVKPSNLFLTDSGLIKVMDFGIAKIVGTDLSLTQTDMLMGSPLCMSAEQITSPKAVDFRTDIYFSSVTLHALLAGEKPYDDAETSMFHIQTAIVHDPLPRLPNVSAAVNEAILRATQKKAADRFADCTEFAQAPAVSLPTATPKTVPAPVPVTAEAPIAALAKNRLPLLAVSVAGIVLVSVGGWFFWSTQTAPSPAPVASARKPSSDNSETKTELSRAKGDLNRAILFYDEQRYDSALALFNRYQSSPAFADKAEALTDLGLIHYYGAPDQEIPQNLPVANEWLEKGVDRQNAKACYYLGLLKDGVDFSTPVKSAATGKSQESASLYKQGAQLGDAYAQATVGELYLLKKPYLTDLDACQVLDYLKQAAEKKVMGASQNYSTLKKSGHCTR